MWITRGEGAGPLFYKSLTKRPRVADYWADADADALGAGGVLFGTISAVTGLGRITALPGVAGVVDVGGGLPPHAANVAPIVSAMRSERIGSEHSLPRRRRME